MMKFLILLLALSTIMTSSAFAQPRIRAVAGQITLDEIAPAEPKYAHYEDSLDRVLKNKPDDTTALFYRAFLYLQFNSFQAKPDPTANAPTARLLTAKGFALRADSLKMHDLKLLILCAQICKELTNRFAPMETWRFSAVQLARRKELFEINKNLANRYYDRLQQLDSGNAYDYQKLKVN